MKARQDASSVMSRFCSLTLDKANTKKAVKGESARAAEIDRRRTLKRQRQRDVGYSNNEKEGKGELGMRNGLALRGLA